MNSLAGSLCAYLGSRNNDIAGYWGIGMLCATSKREGKRKFSFKIYPGRIIKIYGFEITDSKIITEMLVKFDLDSIEGRVSFFEDGRYPHGAEKFTCGIAIAITQGGRTGLSMSHSNAGHTTQRESVVAQASKWRRLRGSPGLRTCCAEPGDPPLSWWF